MKNDAGKAIINWTWWCADGDGNGDGSGDDVDVGGVAA